jgi:hypothetical protein
MLNVPVTPADPKQGVPTTVASYEDFH